MSGPPALAGRVVHALAYCVEPANLRRTVTIAAVVGTILTVINLGDVIAAGQLTGSVWLKIAANYTTPFVVANLGLISGRRRYGPS